MSATNRKFDSAKLLMLLFVITGIATPTGGSTPRKLDDTTVPAPPDSGVKCGSCSTCNNPCYQSPPPPPVPKRPPTQYCPPPPSGFVYVYGPPGSIYPVDPFYSRAGQSIAVGLPLLIGCGLVALLAFW